MRLLNANESPRRSVRLNIVDRSNSGGSDIAIQFCGPIGVAVLSNRVILALENHCSMVHFFKAVTIIEDHNGRLDVNSDLATVFERIYAMKKSRSRVARP